MKIAKTALVSTIALGIAMGAAALSAGPSLAQQNLDTPARATARAGLQLPITGKQTCSNVALTLPTGVSTSTGLTITFTLGAPKAVALIFSTEVHAGAGGTVNVDYSIDGAATPIPIGPEFFADDTPAFTTRTAYGVVEPPFVTKVLKAGKHTITPFLKAVGAAGVADFHCFAVLNTGV